MHRPDYFGFAAIDCGWDAPNDGDAKTNYIDEVSGFTNIAQMCVYIPEDFLSERLNLFQQSGVKALLHVEAVLFDHIEDTASPSGTRTILFPDAQARWDTFMRINENLITLDRVAAIYIVDEPVWNGLSQGDFTQAVDIVNASFPQIPTMMVEAYTGLDQIFVPESIDWVGFDRYGTLDPASDQEWLADIGKVRAARSREDQKIILVVESFWLPMYGDAGYPPKRMGEFANNYYAFVTNNPDIIALIGYLWPGGLDAPDELGARDLPQEVLETYRRIGVEIIKR